MPEKTISILGVVVPDESPAFLAIIAVHIAIALPAVVSGAAAMFARKGVGLHSRLGSLYYRLLFGVFVTATILAVLRWTRNWHLFVLGTLAFATATLGRLSLRRSRERLEMHVSAMGASYILMLTAFYVDNGKNLPVWKELPAILYWTLPALVGVPLLVRAVLRHPLIRGSRA